MWFTLEKCDKNFIKNAPCYLRKEIILSLPPDKVFKLLTGEEIKDWMEDFLDLKWTSPPPYGENSTRKIKLKIMSAKEVFIKWEADKRVTFYFSEITVPVAKAIMEDWKLEEVEDNKTKVIWGIYYKPNVISSMINPVLKLQFGNMQKRSLKELSDYIEKNKSLL